MLTYRYQFRAMACDNSITLFAPAEAKANEAANAAISEVKRIEAKYSRYLADSVLSYINRQAGSGVSAKIDSETALLLDFADTCYQQSGGLFDITSGVLRRVWDFRADEPPSREAITSVLPLVGWDRIQRSPSTVMLPETGMEIDFGGFGKEYAADRAAAILLSHGIHHGFVDLGGDVVVTGAQIDGAAWSLGVRHPREESQLLATVAIASGAVATSGDYERYIDFAGQRYSHILNPKTGDSVHGFQSVTAFAPSCMVAGSITTIAMLKGEKEGSEWLANLATPESTIKALSVGADGVLRHYP
jgi:FAD:protein FMN transferase